MKAVAAVMLAVLVVLHTACAQTQHREARLLPDDTEYSLITFLQRRGVPLARSRDNLVQLQNTAEARRALADFEMFSRTYLDVIENNIVNADSTRRHDGKAGPYRRQFLALDQQGDIREISEDSRPVSRYFMRYEPEHPDANAEGYVVYPDVDLVSEMTDIVEANHQRDIALELLRRFDTRLVVPHRSTAVSQFAQQWKSWPQ